MPDALLSFKIIRFEDSQTKSTKVLARDGILCMFLINKDGRWNNGVLPPASLHSAMPIGLCWRYWRAAPASLCVAESS